MTFSGTVGFAGLGGMGAGLVKNLLARGVSVTVMDRRAKPVELKLIHNYIAFAKIASWYEGFALAAKEELANAMNDVGYCVERLKESGLHRRDPEENET